MGADSLPLIFFFGIGLLLLRGLVLVEPNQARVVLLFGKYKGTIREPGFYFINPLTSRKAISLRVNNFDSTHSRSTTCAAIRSRSVPSSCGACDDSAQASFDVERYEPTSRCRPRRRSARRAAKHPYDSADPSVVSLRGDSEEVNVELLSSCASAFARGLEVLEVRLSHLAYAPEIAGVMLRRQQAEAIIDARTRIVEGAVGMVKLALDSLEAQKVVRWTRTSAPRSSATCSSCSARRAKCSRSCARTRAPSGSRADRGRAREREHGPPSSSCP